MLGRLSLHDAWYPRAVDQAAEPIAARADGDAPELAARLRRLIIGLTVLAVVLLGIGLLPGERVYDDANNCFGRVFGALGNTEHQQSACESSYTRLSETRLAGGLPLAIYLVVVVGPGWLVYRKPRARPAWWWFAWSIVGAVLSACLAFYLEFHLDLFSRTVILWPTRVVEVGIATIQGALLLALPLIIVRSRTPRAPAARLDAG
jgi:hypothetical protein